jgi:hypothetical protein
MKRRAFLGVVVGTIIAPFPVKSEEPAPDYMRMFDDFQEDRKKVDEYKERVLQVLLENQRQMNEEGVCQDISKFKRMQIPLIRRQYDKTIMERMMPSSILDGRW